MVTNTPVGMEEMLGETAELSGSYNSSVALSVEQLERERAASNRATAERLDALVRAARAGAAVMPVAAEVAHAQRVGRRELERRRSRNRAAKRARRTNR
jgi:hypothetical protein